MPVLKNRHWLNKPTGSFTALRAVRTALLVLDCTGTILTAASTRHKQTYYALHNECSLMLSLSCSTRGDHRASATYSNLQPPNSWYSSYNVGANALQQTPLSAGPRGKHALVPVVHLLAADVRALHAAAERLADVGRDLVAEEEGILWVSTSGAGSENKGREVWRSKQMGMYRPGGVERVRSSESPALSSYLVFNLV